MPLPINTFTIHNLLGFMVTASLAVMFYLVYLGMGRRKLDLLAGNFIACAAFMCLSSFLSDNLVHSGANSFGWPGGPGPEELSRATLFFHRLHWSFSLALSPCQMHFVLCYCDSRNLIRRHIGLYYVLTMLILPFIWTDAWFSPREFPLAPTSSWGVAIPYMPLVGWPATPMLLGWCAQQVYILALLWRVRRYSGPTLDDSSRQWGLVFTAFMAQVMIALIDPVSVLLDYTGISFIPIGATLMGVLLAVALVRSRIITHHHQVRLEREKATLLESVQQPLICFDAARRVSWANQAAAELIGRKVGDLLHHSADAVWGKPGSPEMASVEAALRTGKPQRSELNRPEDVYWMLYASPILVNDAIAGVILLVMDVTVIRRAEEMLRQANAKILAAREDERRRVARELHDSLAQKLAVMRLGLHGGPSDADEAQKLLAAAAVECQEIIKELRAICYELYPAALDLLGLGRGLNELAGKYRDVGKECVLDCPAELRNIRFTREIEIALYRVCQEALSNAIRHGKAERIGISLRNIDDELRMTVSDDGIGFDPEDQSRYGIGMSSMKGRVDGIGGMLEITSQPGLTQVCARVRHRPGSQPASRVPLDTCGSPDKMEAHGTVDDPGRLHR